MAEQDKNTEKRNRVRKRYFWKWTGLSIALMIIIVIVLVSSINTWMASYTRHDEYTNVPDLSNVTDDDAIKYLEQIGLKGMVIDSVYADLRPGAVVDQLPIAGLPVRYGRIVYLTVQNRAVRTVTINEDMHQWSSRQVLSRLQEIGFIVDSIQHVPLIPDYYDDQVSDIYITNTSHSLVVGQKYPLRTHVIVSVVSSQIEEETKEGETDGGEI